MNFVKQIERLQLLNKLIREESTGSPDELAGRLGLSRRRLYDVIEDLECWGAQVSYDRKNHTFCYTKPFDLDIQFSLSVMADDEVKKIFGGSAFFCFRAMFLHGAPLPWTHHWSARRPDQYPARAHGQ